MSLSNDQKAELEQLIKDDILQVQQSIEDLQDQIKPISPDSAIGRISRMDAIEQQSVNQVKLNTQQAHLIELTQTIQRMKNDPDFSYCKNCGESIVFERLKLRPEVTICMACLNQQEAQQ